MTRFLDGPAARKWLELKRMPLFLRVCIAADGTVDALDQLDDEPRVGEVLYAYRREGEIHTIHIDYVDSKTRRRCGRWIRSANYRLCPAQPDDGAMRDRVRWQEWCQLAYKKEKV